MSTTKTALPELAAALVKHGLALNYTQVFRHANSGLFPVVRERGRVYAVAEPADIAKAILARVDGKQKSIVNAKPAKRTRQAAA